MGQLMATVAGLTTFPVTVPSVRHGQDGRIGEGRSSSYPIVAGTSIVRPSPSTAAWFWQWKQATRNGLAPMVGDCQRLDSALSISRLVSILVAEVQVQLHHKSVVAAGALTRELAIHCSIESRQRRQLSLYDEQLIMPLRRTKIQHKGTPASANQSPGSRSTGHQRSRWRRRTDWMAAVRSTCHTRPGCQ